MAPLVKRRKVRKSPNLLCCRACLETEGKLYNIHECGLADVFTRVTGIPVKVDKFPQHLCMWCAMLLRKCTSFREKCHRARLCLVSELVKRDLATKYIKTVDRVANRLVDLTTTPIDNIDYTDESNKDMIQLTIEIDDQSHLSSEINDTHRNSELNVLLNTSNEEVEYLEDDFMEDEVVEDSKDEKGDIDELMSYESAVQFSDEFDDDDNIDLLSLKMNSVKVLKQEEMKDNNVKVIDKSETRKKAMEMHNILSGMDDAEFESTYGVKVIYLSKEEQLEEIESRRASRHYLEAPFRCEPCGKPFQREAPYNNHRARHSPSIGEHSCCICSMRFRCKARRRTHEQLHRVKFVCQCGFVGRSRDQTRRHYEEKGQTFKCEHCGKRFSKVTTYRNHLRDAHSTLNEACALCGETFVGHYGLRLHMGRAHFLTTQQMKNMKCATCSMTFVTLDAVKRHKAIDHTGYPCVQCGKSCVSEESLREHKEKHHPWCKECSQRFVDVVAFEKHIERKHLGRRPVQGPPAGGWGAARGARGVRRSASGVPRVARGAHGASLVCDVCGKVMKGNFQLQAHLRGHGQKSYKCPYCPKAFPFKNSRLHHLRTHTGDKPYQCDHCRARFSLKTNMRRHILTVHMGNRKMVPCHVCGRHITEPNLQLHVNAAHFGIPWPKRNRGARSKAKARDEKSDEDLD